MSAAKELIAEGRAEGHAEGWAEGWAEGHAEGSREALRKVVLRLARKQFGEAEAQRAEVSIRSATTAQLEAALDRILSVETVDDIFDI